MSLTKRDVKKHAKAITRRRLQAKERHEHQQRQAQRDIDALHQALHDVGLPAMTSLSRSRPLARPKKLLGKIFGLMFPTLFGCRSAHELTRVRVGQNVPSRILGALPSAPGSSACVSSARISSVPCGAMSRQRAPPPAAAGSGPGYGTTRCFANTGKTWSLLARGTVANISVVTGIDGVLLLVVLGEGTLVVPVDFAVRRPDPKGPGARCRSKLGWSASDARRVSRPCADAAWSCPHRWWWLIVGSATRS